MVEMSYNSVKQTDYAALHAPYYNAIRDTEILFEEEKIIATVNSVGHIEFFDEEKQSLGAVDIPAAESPDMYAHSGQYGEVRYKAEKDVISFELPLYRWEDSYPHCDGESDRWSRYVVRWFHVVFDVKTKQIAIPDR